MVPGRGGEVLGRGGHLTSSSFVAGARKQTIHAPIASITSPASGFCHSDDQAEGEEGRVSRHSGMEAE